MAGGHTTVKTMGAVVVEQFQDQLRTGTQKCTHALATINLATAGISDPTTSHPHRFCHRVLMSLTFLQMAHCHDVASIPHWQLMYLWLRNEHGTACLHN
jgi:hypothetical protein